MLYNYERNKIIKYKTEPKTQSHPIEVVTAAPC